MALAVDAGTWSSAGSLASGANHSHTATANACVAIVGIADNGSATDRPLKLLVDGNVAAARLSFGPTGSWRTWKTATQTVLLSAGRHAVVLASDGLNGPNLDALTVGPGPTT